MNPHPLSVQPTKFELGSLTLAKLEGAPSMKLLIVLGRRKQRQRLRPRAEDASNHDVSPVVQLRPDNELNE
jgi:hypothetical protein